VYHTGEAKKIRRVPTQTWFGSDRNLSATNGRPHPPQAHLAIASKTRLFEKQIAAIRKRSQILAKIIDKQVAKATKTPSFFEALKFQPEHPAFVLSEQGILVRKAKATHDRHDYRLVFLHKPDEGGGKVSFLYARNRRDVYELIDSDMVLETAAEL
jgi:hypothetical protein